MKAFEKFLILVIFLSGAFTLRSLFLNQKPDNSAVTMAAMNTSQFLGMSHVLTKAYNQFVKSSASIESPTLQLESVEDVEALSQEDRELLERLTSGKGIPYQPHIQEFVDLAKAFEASGVLQVEESGQFEDENGNTYFVLQPLGNSSKSILRLIKIDERFIVVNVTYYEDGGVRRISRKDLLGSDEWVEFSHNGYVSDESHIQKDL